MMQQQSNLSISALKQQAKELRKALARDGQNIGHSTALELLAKEHGFRNWNTLYAQVSGQENVPPFTIGQRLKGTYLGQKFTGELLKYKPTEQSGYMWVTLKFDQPVDVVTFDSFSCFRQRICKLINPKFETDDKTSNGEPHLRIYNV